MKRVIKSAKFFSPYLNEDEQQDRLKIPTASVRDRLLDNVDDQDKEVFNFLISNKIFPTIASSAELRNNPYYSLDDKFIQKLESHDDCTVYSIPYAGGGRWDTGKIFTKTLTVYDDGSFQFGSGKRRTQGSAAVSTLKNDFFRSRDW